MLSVNQFIFVFLPFSHDITIKRIQDTFVGQLKRIVQNLFAFTTEKETNNDYDMATVKIRGSIPLREW